MDPKTTIQELIEEIRGLGTMLPGTISTQYNVCGKAHCQCKDTSNPKKHGPYHQLSYTVRGRSSSLFVKKADIQAVTTMVARHKRCKELFAKLIEAYVELVRSEGFSEATDFVPVSVLDERITELSKVNTEQERVLKDLQARCAKWRTKAKDRTALIESYRATMRDLEKSRNKWKEKTKQAQALVQKLEEQVHHLENTLGAWNEKKTKN